MYDLIIIGAGVIGCMIAREASRYNMSTLVIEKSNDVGNKTSSANSAIIHSGYDPIPNTNKAKFNVLGNKMFANIAKELDVPFIQNGSMTIATFDSQLPMLEDLAKRAKLNNVEVELLSKEEVLKLEPNITKEVKGALLAKSAGIIDPFLLCVHAMENAVDNGVNLIRNKEVISIDKIDNNFDYGFIVKCKDDDNNYQGKIVINSAGLYSDKIASMIEEISWSIIPKKGSYFVLEHFSYDYMKHTIFPLPSEKGKGILFSMTTSGNYIVGPTSELIEDKDDTSTSKESLSYIKQQASNMIPSIPFNKTIRTFSGVRASSSRHDFIIEPSNKYKCFINVCGIESPGLVSSPAIAKYVIEELTLPNLTNIKEKSNFNPYVKKHHKLFDAIKNNDFSFINEHKEYGQVICSCERVSKGEILDELSRSVPPISIKGIKRRTRAGYGKCQGGFCQSKIVLLLAEFYNISPLDIMLNDEESYLLSYIIKE